MLSSMTILAAFSLLSMYTCSALFPLPGGQIWGSNTFSSFHKRSFYPRPRWVIFGVECWHNTTSFTTTTNDYLKPRKQVRTKPHCSLSLLTLTMPTSRDVNISSILDTEGSINLISNEDEGMQASRKPTRRKERRKQHDGKMRYDDWPRGKDSRGIDW